MRHNIKIEDYSFDVFRGTTSTLVNWTKNTVIVEKKFLSFFSEMNSNIKLKSITKRDVGAERFFLGLFHL